ncbi:Palmitoyltransferase swf1 [Smittium culicis]|uniref:Palmitoyltransferase n=2 Tax=Smittium culicis TaxID=133412 RepID=A0A1R1XDY1_9FUNG|nr:Palmitoyltransferase swf1 [Smittium culicis]
MIFGEMKRNDEPIDYYYYMIWFYRAIFVTGYFVLMFVYWVYTFPSYSVGYFGPLGTTIPQVLALIFVPMNAYLYYMMYSVNPGIITKENNEEALKKFQYDYILYRPRYCDICKIKCPARSHHCKSCNVCVLKFDHHCVLTHRCVGINNNRYLLLFCVNLVLISFFGTIFLTMVLMGLAAKKGYPPSFYYSKTTGLNFIKLRHVFFGLYTTHMMEWLLYITLAFVVPIAALFTLYQFVMHAYGLTSFEVFHRSKLSGMIKEKKIYFVIPPPETGHHKFVKYFDPEEDKKNDREPDPTDEYERVLITSIDQLPHQYSLSVYENFKTILFPDTLEPTTY